MITLNRSGSMLSTILVGALLSGNGLAAEPAPDSTNTAVFAAKTAAPHQPLDLRAPQITQLYTS